MSSTPTPQTAPQSAPPVVPAEDNKKKKIGLIIGIISAFLCICLACLAVFGLGLFKVNSEKEPVAAVLDTYMRYMAAQDTASAYALFSPEARTQFSQDSLQALLASENAVVFYGYQSLEINSINVSASTNGEPAGTVAEVSGIVYYQDGSQGQFESMLQKVDGQWMLYNVYVTR